MSIPVICIDVDNVLADYTGGLRHYVQKHCDDQYPCPDPTAYDFSLADGWPFSGSLDSYQGWHRRAVSDGLYLKLKPFEGAAGTVRRLHDTHHRVVISTTRSDEEYETADWLARNGIPGRLHHGRKADLLDWFGRLDILIDDNPESLEECSRHTRLLLHPDFEYCKTAPGIAYHSWADIPRIIAAYGDGTLGEGMA